MGKRIKKRLFIILLLMGIGCFFFEPSMIFAQKLTHTVQKGDTLWDICEKYYGDPDLWPKLWQMNPFVTNPHLLHPGDVITLFEKEPVKEVKHPAKEPPVKEPEPEPRVMGINVADLTRVDSVGYLSLEEINPWGTLFATDNNKLLLAKGDTAFVLFDEKRQVTMGDEFSVGRSSSLLKHPVTGKDLGYTFFVNGKLVVEERLEGNAYRGKKSYKKKNLYRTKIIEGYEPIHIDDIVMPVQSVSPCVLPVSINKNVLGNIVASKGQQSLIQPNSIVYIDLGSNGGVNRGNVFEVVRPNEVPDPKPDSIYTLWIGNIILPKTPIGKVMIIESGPDTSTAIVLSVTENVSIGDYIKGISWEDTPDFLLTMANCPIE